MVVFAGQGDPRRSMDLLWRTSTSKDTPARTGPGPKPGLSVDVIVDTAIAIADAEGMAALSMRAVGERLGRTAMALYTYVPGKSELVDLMYDRAYAELPGHYDLSVGWRDAVTEWVHDAWSFYSRHPWTLQVSQTRPVLGPNEYVMFEALLRILRDTGLPPRVLRRVVGLLFYFVRGAAGTIVESRQAATTTGLTDDEWWTARSALLSEVAPDFSTRFPTVAWMESEGVFDGEECEPYFETEARQTLDVGLTVILDGIEATMATNRPPQTDRRHSPMGDEARACPTTPNSSSRSSAPIGDA